MKGNACVALGSRNGPFDLFGERGVRRAGAEVVMLPPNAWSLRVVSIVKWCSGKISRGDRCDRTIDGLVYRKDRS